MQVAKARIVPRLPARESSTSEGKDSNKYTLVIKHSYLGHLAEVGPATCSCLAQNMLQVNSIKSTLTEMAKLLLKEAVD